MELGLTHQCVLITGASRGIGRAAAECFASEGCRLRLVARNRAHLDATAAHLADRYGVDVQAMALSVLRHRVVRNYKAEAEGFSQEELIKQLL
jgi:short-subunit dehydrogenase